MFWGWGKPEFSSLGGAAFLIWKEKTLNQDSNHSHLSLSFHKDKGLAMNGFLEQKFWNPAHEALPLTEEEF